MCFALGENQDGLEALDAYLAVNQPFDSDSAEAHEKRGKVLRRLMARETVPETRKRLREAARQQLREAEKLGGKSAELYRELGAMYDDPKTADRAIEYYSRGLEVEAGHPQLRLNRALAYAQYLQDYKNARADLAEAAKVADSHADAGKIRVETQTCLGYVCRRQKQVAAAQAAATLALLYERENGRTHFITLHNVACIFAELSLTDPDHAHTRMYA